MGVVDHVSGKKTHSELSVKPFCQNVVNAQWGERKTLAKMFVTHSGLIGSFFVAKILRTHSLLK